MLLAYVHCFGVQADAPELCIVPDKPDQFSVPVRVDALSVTEAALLRVSPSESLTVRKDPSDGAIIVEAVKPSKLYLTPDLPQSPGVGVRRLKIQRTGPRQYLTWFVPESGSADQWSEWSPLKSMR